MQRILDIDIHFRLENEKLILLGQKFNKIRKYHGCQIPCSKLNFEY